MSDRRRRSLAAGATGLGLGLALAVAGAPALAAPASQPLFGWLTSAAKFPHRTLVLVPPAGATLVVARIHVAENRKPVSGAAVTKVATAPTGSLGVMLVIDGSKAMRGTGLSAAVAAGRQLAAARFPGELVGLVSAGAKATVELAPTTDGTALQRALNGLSASQIEGDSPAGVSVALAQLHAAKVALGAIVVISDGAGLKHATSTSLRSLVKAAGASHTSVVTIGVRDAASAPSTLEALRRSLPGQFTATAPTAVPGVVGAVQNSLGDDYLVSYRSTLPAGTPVAVTANVHGLAGTVRTSYQAPAPRGSASTGHASTGHASTGHASTGHASVGTASGHAGLVPNLTHSTPLSPKPSFASTAPSQPSTHAPATSAQPAAPAGPAQAPFWSSPRASLAVAGGAGLLLMLALWAILYRPSRRTVRVRIESFIPTETPELDPQRVATVRRGGPLSRLQRGSWWPPFVENVEISRMRQAPIELVKRAAILAVVVGVLLGLLSGEPLLAAVPILAWPFALRAFVNRAVTKQRNKFGDSLPSYLHDLASSIRVGRSFVGALAVVGESADEPTRGEFERAATNEALGRPLEECLEAVSRRMLSSDMDQVALIAGLNRRSGSNVAEALERVAEGSRERADMRREMRALSAQAKMSSLVLTALPGVLLLGLSVISPMYAHPLLHTTLGLIALGAGAAMCFSGWKVMQKITNVDAV